MAKFNVVQKRRRALIAEKKRQLHGDPLTGKLKIKDQPLSLSGKRKRKLFKKWRRDQKDALQNGLVTMEDVQMAVAEGDTKDTPRPSPKIHLKKKALKLKQLKRKGKNKRKSDVPADVSADAMVE
ncbi:hypothetical protein AAZX31_05G001000 [Glycine max]|uniref:Uncharacterized protein n=1 Tax=Glycine max TaxID=3847 RepID=I1K1P8_SOYBN|nr:uncharacterized protein LOC100500554 isoform X1 [Glycine max]XP_028231053.1 uncharacterized protein LOC114411625 isoform X2 [Glycine soja]KAH1132089.1 hypothetical protein GYH30_011117 [Glycine max]KAH1132091.1 hypothetical protein GYH30_011117 [Glycine max]KAH1248349.1 hypothetical protein GmHk_05G011973 [Glycine max]KHN27490.1 hypothetical protein glysoja_022199 [Glycine soja]KRH56502.1 hypothetical protein GLYMA_05G000800v4 [Glycine max]|eukprot:XP_006579370.1 uncharacterized protein LOC100500554 isoform X1 [Glycine max]